MGLRPRSECLHSIVNVSATGQIIAGLVGSKTTIYALILHNPAATANTVTITDNSTSPVALSAPYSLNANEKMIVLDRNNGDPWWQTTAGVANAGPGGTTPNGGISLTLSAATQIVADIYYTQEVIV
jgi:hypothetical protein